MRHHDLGFFLHAESVLPLLGVFCLVGCVLFLVIGARAAGLAMLGALQGAVIAAVASIVTTGLADVYDDAVWWAGAIGASVGAVVFGLVGLAWKPRASRSVLRRSAAILAVVGALAVIGVNASAVPACASPPARVIPPCLETNSLVSDGFITGIWLPMLIAFDSAFVVWLLLMQATRATRSPIEKERSGVGSRVRGPTFTRLGPRAT